MRTSSLFIASALVFAIACGGGATTSPHRLSAPVADLQINMSYEAFTQSRDMSVMAVAIGEDPNEGLYYLTGPGTEGANEVTYQFSEGLLYEIIVKYPDAATARRVALEQMGAPENVGDHWELDAGNGLTLRIWVHENKYIVADQSHFN